MLTNYGGDFPFKMTELYEKIELSPKHYSRWVKLNLLSSFYPFKDYKEITQLSDNQSLSLVESEFKAGKYRTEYLLTKRTAEELALISKTPKGKELRKWLLDLKERVESNELLTLQQVYFLIDLVNAFSFVVNQKAIEESHKQRYIEKYLHRNGRIDLQFICQQFHLYRNEALDISPETIRERMLRFCDDENRMISPNKNKREILAILDKYSLIGNAAFDFMATIDKSDKVSINVSEMVKGLAKQMNAEIRETNSADLFNDEMFLNPVIMREVTPFVNNRKLKESIKQQLN
jgi:phage anti-repressor protein